LRIIAVINHWHQYAFRLAVVERRNWFLIIPLILALVACSTSSLDGRPSDDKLRHGINLLMSEFEKRHPQSVGWNDAAVKVQVSKSLPKGHATEAGWNLEWPSATNQELSRVVVPWRLIGPLPKNFDKDSTNYTGGTPAPASVVAEIKPIKEAVDPWFAAVVNIRLSKVDPNWAIFTAVPFLPVTDVAYGWAQNQNSHWQVFDFGTALVGCGVTPAAVLSEFGFACP
jgi:hypothetical protein